MDHRVSKTASEQFWALATNLLPEVLEAKQVNQVHKKIPQFRSLRAKMYEEDVPPINLEVAYECKETGDVIIMQGLSKTPVKRFPPSQFIKLYESAKVSVSVTPPPTDNRLSFNKESLYISFVTPFNTFNLNCKFSMFTYFKCPFAADCMYACMCVRESVHACMHVYMLVCLC